ANQRQQADRADLVQRRNPRREHHNGEELALYLRMIFSEDRYTLFRIMRQRRPASEIQKAPALRSGPGLLLEQVRLTQRVAGLAAAQALGEIDQPHRRRA